jgi:adenylosuccinate lyase
MPHKRNPITSENICGCARVMKSYVSVGLDNNILWHERDISHSSAERIVLADATTLIDYMLNRYADTLDRLTVFPEQMKANIYLTNGIIFSGRIMTSMIDKGMSREEAYDLVQKYTMISWNEKKDFIRLISESPVKEYLSEEEIRNCLTLDYYMKYVDLIYERLGIKGE